MTIKDENGSHSVTSQSQGTLNTVLGAVGAAGALGLAGGLFNRNNPDNLPPDEKPVTRYELGLNNEIGAKNTEIAELRAKMYADEKINTVVKEQYAINLQQATYNGVNTATLQCMQGQISQLFSLTQLTIPNGNLNPGYGQAIVMPMPAPAVAPTSTAKNTGNAAQGD